MLVDIKLGAGIAVILTLAGIAGQSDYEAALLEERAYCASVTQYMATQGSEGWPDYRLLYDSMCVKYSLDPELFFPG